MEFSFKIKVNSKKEEIWKYYADIENWYIWEEDLKDISLNGKFETGSEGIMELKGMPPIKYSLVSVTENKEFQDMTEIPSGKLYFGHEISENGSGVDIKHTVRLESDIINEENIMFLKRVFSDVPKSMFLLKKAVETK